MEENNRKDSLIRFIFVSIILAGLLAPVVITELSGSQQTGPKTKNSSKSSETNNLKVTKQNTRAPAVAGQFYPANKTELRQKISGFLNQAEVISHDGKVRILVVPHAGLEYSGSVAASGFKQISGKEYSRVIIIGGSHKKAINYAAVYSEGAWETPLGITEVDSDFAARLLEPEAGIVKDLEAHSPEHSLEQELIFLQLALEEFKIVPILLGNISEETAQLLAYKLSYLIDDQTLIVVSTDLSHYPTWEQANYSDEKTVDAILTGSKETFTNIINEIEKENIPNLSTCACGHEAVKVALRVSNILDVSDFQKIKYQNSGDITGDKSRVVGYASVAAWSGNLSPLELSEKTKKEILTLSRNTLESYLKTKKVPEVNPSNPYLHLPIGAFTTLKNSGNLRGCIGEFEPNLPLYKVIQETTISAASKDLRFQPVQKEELPNISIEISLMTPKRLIDNWQKVELGKHGVVIESNGRSGTFLPQVVESREWTKESFLGELCSQKVKAERNCYKDPNTKIYVYEAESIEEE